MAYFSELNVQTYAVVIAVLAAIAYAFVHRRAGGHGDGTLQSMVLDNMTQGVVLFDAHERVLVVNDRYVEMYGLSPAVVKPGCTLMELIQNRITTGSLNIDPEKYRSEIMTAVRAGAVMNRMSKRPTGAPSWWSTGQFRMASTGSERMTTSPNAFRPKEKAPRYRSRNAAV